MNRFEKYLKKIKGNFREAIKVEWLNNDESVNFEFTNSLYDMSVQSSVNYQNGSRRSCTLTINNDRNKFPINPNSIWFGQKFKLWRGVYLDDETPYYFPHGVFYVSNPTEVYNPDSKTITINGVDKWSYLDGTLNGKLNGTYQTNIGTNLYSAIRALLKTPRTIPLYSLNNSSLSSYFNIENDTYSFGYDSDSDSYMADGSYIQRGATARTELTAKHNMIVSFDYGYWTDGNSARQFSVIVGDSYVEDHVYSSSMIKKSYTTLIAKGETIIFEYYISNTTIPGGRASFSNIRIDIGCPVVDVIEPFISPSFLDKTYTVDGNTINPYECPYTVKVERGKTYADVLLEYANILCANIYYD